MLGKAVARRDCPLSSRVLLRLAEPNLAVPLVNIPSDPQGQVSTTSDDETWITIQHLFPEGPSTQHLRTLVPKTIPLMVFWDQSPYLPC